MDGWKIIDTLIGSRSAKYVRYTALLMNGSYPGRGTTISRDWDELILEAVLGTEFVPFCRIRNLVNTIFFFKNSIIFSDGS
jgi:hypothetical protein